MKPTVPYSEGLGVVVMWLALPAGFVGSFFVGPWGGGVASFSVLMVGVLLLARAVDKPRNAQEENL